MQRLASQLDQLARRQRNHAFWIRGCLWTSLALLVVVALIGIDYTFRIRSPIVRWISAAVGWSVLTMWIFAVRRARRSIPTRVESARLWEQATGQTDDLVSSAAEFLSSRRSTGLIPELPDSADLRAETVRRAADSAWRQRIDRHGRDKPSRATRMAIVGAASLVACIALAVAPRLWVVGLPRLFFPSRSIHWPARHEIFLARFPRKVVAGVPVTVDVMSIRGPLPQQVELLLRDGDSGAEQRTVLAPQGRTRIRHALGPLVKSVQVRATGGDGDTMPWHQIEVIPLPQCTTCTALVVPPEYLRSDTFELRNPDTRVVAGSSISLQGTATMEQGTALLAVDSRDSTLPEHTRVSLNDSRFELTAVIKASGLPREIKLRLILIDDRRVTNSNAWQSTILLEPDGPPSVVWNDRHRSAREITRQGLARLPVRMEDDYGFSHIELQLRTHADDPGRQWTLDLPPMDAGKATEQVLTWSPGDEGLDSEMWQLPQEWLIRVHALDLAGQSATTSWRTLQVVTISQFLQRIDDAMRAVVADIAQWVHLQQPLRDTTFTWQGRSVDEPTDLSVADAMPSRLDASHFTDYEQVRDQQMALVAMALDGDRGAVQQIDSLLAELTDNRVEMTALAREIAVSRQKVNTAMLSLSTSGTLMEEIELTRGQAGEVPSQLVNDLVREQTRTITILQEVLDTWYARYESDRLRAELESPEATARLRTGDQPAGAVAASVSLLANLRIITTIQRDLHDRAVAAERVAPDRRGAELAELAELQRELARWTAGLLVDPQTPLPDSLRAWRK